MIFAFLISYDVKFDNRHDASAASTKAEVSAAIVFLHIGQFSLDCHIIRDKNLVHVCNEHLVSHHTQTNLLNEASLYRISLQ